MLAGRFDAVPPAARANPGRSRQMFAAAASRATDLVRVVIRVLLSRLLSPPSPRRGRGHIPHRAGPGHTLTWAVGRLELELQGALGDNAAVDRALAEPRALLVLRQVRHAEDLEQRAQVRLDRLDAEHELVGD